METLTLEELLEAKQVLDFQIGQIIKTGGGNLRTKYGGALGELGYGIADYRIRLDFTNGKGEEEATYSKILTPDGVMTSAEFISAINDYKDKSKTNGKLSVVHIKSNTDLFEKKYYIIDPKTRRIRSEYDVKRSIPTFDGISVPKNHVIAINGLDTDESKLPGYTDLKGETTLKNAEIKEVYYPVPIRGIKCDVEYKGTLLTLQLIKPLETPSFLPLADNFTRRMEEVALVAQSVPNISDDLNKSGYNIESEAGAMTKENLDQMLLGNLYKRRDELKAVAKDLLLNSGLYLRSGNNIFTSGGKSSMSIDDFKNTFPSLFYNADGNADSFITDEDLMKMKTRQNDPLSMYS
jgi:hypothetical protein